MKVLHLINELDNSLSIQNILMLNDKLSKRSNLYFEIICGKIKDETEAEHVNIKIKENESFLKDNRNMRNFFSALTFLRKYCKENNIDILHAHYDYGALISSHTAYTVKLITIRSIIDISELNQNVSDFKTDKLVISEPGIYHKIRHIKNIQSEIVFIDQKSPLDEFVQNYTKLYNFG